MSFHEYQVAREILKTDPPFYSLIIAAMHKADTFNTGWLKVAFPDVWVEAEARYNTAGGKLDSD